MGKVIYCGPYYNPAEETKVIELGKGHLNNASNRFQAAILEGLMSLLKTSELTIVNSLPIGTWPRSSSKLLLSNRTWRDDGYKAHEIGSINFPAIKQIDREIRLFHYLKKIVEPGDYILLYSCYLPFMNAICRLHQKVHFSLIVTDLPEYYDLGHTTLLKRIMRTVNNKQIYNQLKRVDSFVLLTEQMKKPLHVGSRPYVVIEGVWTEDTHNQKYAKINCEKKIIFYSGTLHFKFGIQILLDAFQQIRGSDYELWICGAGDAEDTIKTLALNDNRIKFFGFCSSKRVFELRSNATVLVNPRPPEGEYTKYSFPSKTMEYLSSGIPTVMYRLPGIPQEYNEYLFFVDEPGADALRKKLLAVCAMSVESRKEYALKATHFIKEQKNGTVQAAKILALMKG